MSQSAKSPLIKSIHWWEENILQRPWWLLIVSVILAGFVMQYTMNNLTMQTNTAEMLSTKLPFQQDRIKLETSFPQDANTVLLIVEAKTPEQTAEAVKRITQGLRQQKEQIESVYLPDEGDFFAKNGMLYLNTKELQDLSQQLANAQPFIGKLSTDNSLGGLFDILGKALKESDIDLDLKPLFQKIDEALQANLQNKPYQLSWQQLMMDKQTGLGITKRFIIAKPKLNFQEFVPAEKSLTAIKQVISEALMGDLSETQVRLTGEVVLEYEEMQTISQGNSIAVVVSMFLVCATLWIAYRSFKLMFATFFTLTIGLIFSLGFATVAVGHLNLISVAFAVLFIGMGDAYSSHFCLRYRELILRGLSQRDALRESLTSTGASLMLCTLTASIGLFAFIPTNYVGVSELGVIAGTSMVIALITTFTILPALIKIMPLKAEKPKTRRKLTSTLLSNWPLTYARPIRWITVVLGIVAAALVTQVKVDFNPINLRDPNTESVKTFKYLLKSKDTSPMTLTSLATSPEEALDKKARLEKLATVDKVMTLFDFIPQDQETKLATIEDMGLILGPQLASFPAPSQLDANIAALNVFKAILDAHGDKDDALIHLNETLGQFLNIWQGLDPETQKLKLNQLQASLLSALPATIQKLQLSLEAEPITLEKIPEDLKERWLSKNGLYRVQAFPKKDLNDLESMREFILEAQQVDEHVTDLPVGYLESMNEVIKAFQQAFSVALGAITILLIIIMRDIKDTLLVLLPLLLASLFTAAATVLFNVPFNFANIIALPLLFGLGVDSGIHMAHRLHYLHSNEENLLGSSEAQGVFFGALTTIFSFLSLAFTSHQGTATMGILLATGLLMTLVCSLIVLPAFSSLRIKPRSNAH